MADGGENEDGQPGQADNEGPVYTETDPSGRYGRFDQILGRGAFKTVYKAFDTQEGTEVAWNQVKVSELVNCKDSKEERDRLFAEIRVLKQLKHRNIMTFYDSWLDPKNMSINFITELFTSGTLRQYRKRHKHIDEEVLKKWAWQILCGLVYLHGHTPPIIHRDLKCDNIFINGSDGTVKIGDLGLATMLRNRTAPQSVLGTPEFMAPELYEEEYDDRVDVYSFGMCMLELATMEYPYAECKNAAQIYRKVSLGVRPLGLQKVANKELADFINLCISTRDQRPRSRMLLKHPYFDSIRPVGQLSSKSQVGLSNLVGQPDSLSDYGGSTSGLSRSSSVAAEVAGAGESDASAPWAPSGGAPAVSRAAGAAGAQGGEGGPHSDVGSASLRSQERSNVSDLAAASSGLADIAEEGGDGYAPGSEAARDVHGALPAVSPAAPSSPAASTHPPASPPHSPPTASHLSGSSSSSRSSSCGSLEEEEEGQEEEAAAEEAAAAGEDYGGAPFGGSGSVSEEEEEEEERQFSVAGKYQEDSDTFNLRLRICEPAGSVRTVEFEFDIGNDTAISVASEMVEDLQLSQEDAAAIATAIRNEIANLTTHLEEQLSLSLEQASTALQEGLYTSSAALAHSPSTRQGQGAQQQQQQQHPTLESTASAPPQTLAAAPPPAAAAAAQAATAPHPTAAVATPHATAAQAAAAPPPAAAIAIATPHAGAAPVPLLVSLPPSQVALGVAASPRTGALHGPLPSLTPPPESEPEPWMLPPPQPAQPSASAAECLAPTLHLPFTTSTSTSLRRSHSTGPSFGAGASAAIPVREREGGVRAMPPLSPTASGLLSPSGSQDKRIPLNKLFENLQGLSTLHADPDSQQGGGDRGGAPAAATSHSSDDSNAGSPSPPPNPPLPPLPQRSSTGSLSGGGGADGAPVANDDALMRPLSEACLSGLLEQFDPFNLAATPSPFLAPETVVRLTEQQGQARQGVGGVVVEPLGLPGRSLSLSSRDASPSRAATLSPTRVSSCGAFTCDSLASSCAKKGGKTDADKEALRRQAADAMKAVELRSLNLLEGGLAGRTIRGTPMAATKVVAERGAL